MVSEMLGSQREDIILLLEAREASVFPPPGKEGPCRCHGAQKLGGGLGAYLQLSAWTASIISS